MAHRLLLVIVLLDIGLLEFLSSISSHDHFIFQLRSVGLPGNNICILSRMGNWQHLCQSLGGAVLHAIG